MCIYIYIGESGSPVNYYYIHALCNIKHRLCHENEITHLSVGGIVVGFKKVYFINSYNILTSHQALLISNIISYPFLTVRPAPRLSIELQQSHDWPRDTHPSSYSGLTARHDRPRYTLSRATAHHATLSRYDRPRYYLSRATAIHTALYNSWYDRPRYTWSRATAIHTTLFTYLNNFISFLTYYIFIIVIIIIKFCF